MIKFLILLICQSILLFSCTSNDFGEKNILQKNYKPKVGYYAPDFTLKDIDEKEKRLYNFKNKVVFFHFWSTTCPPCLEEMPAIIDLANKLKGLDLVFLLIAVDESWDQVQKVFKVGKMPFIVVLDKEKKVSSKIFNVYKFPETFIINRKGIIIDKFIGVKPWNSTNMVSYFKKLLNN